MKTRITEPGVYESIYADNDVVLSTVKDNYDIIIDGLKFLGNRVFKNDNYIITSGNEKYLLKIFNMNNNFQLGNEALILNELDRNSFVTQKIVKTKNKKHSFFINGRNAAIFTYIEGCDGRDIILTEEIAKDLGKAHATMHKVLQNIELDTRGTTRNFDYEKTLALYNKHKGDLGREEIKFFESSLQMNYIPENLEIGIVHSSVKRLNTIFKDGKFVTFIDFDGCYQGKLLLDISNTIAEFFIDKDRVNYELMKCYLNSYLEIMPIDISFIQKAIKFSLCRQALKWKIASIGNDFIDEETFQHYIDCHNLLENETRF